MEIDGLVREGRRSVNGMTGLCPSRTKPSMGQSRLGFMCQVEEGVGGGGGGGGGGVGGWGGGVGGGGGGGGWGGGVGGGG